MAAALGKAAGGPVKLAELQTKLAAATVEGIAGAGAVRVRFTAGGQCVGVTIDPVLASKHTVLQDLTKAAVNDGIRKAAEEGMRLQAEWAKEAFGGAGGMASALAGMMGGAGGGGLGGLGSLLGGKTEPPKLK